VLAMSSPPSLSSSTSSRTRSAIFLEVARNALGYSAQHMLAKPSYSASVSVSKRSDSEETAVHPFGIFFGFFQSQLCEKTHMLKQQTLHPLCYPPRAIAGEPLEWSDDTYKPPEFEAGVLHQKVKPAWADAPHIYDIMQVGERLSYDMTSNTPTTVLLSCTFDPQTRRFKNPKGKTGIRGRGELGRWGPNHAADVIVTRTTEEGNHMALLCTKKVGDGKSALCWPAGMVEPGHTVPQTLKLELTQEALEDSAAVDRLFNECDKGVVYAGLVDDWRNTDDAWIETVAQHYHAPEEIAKQLQLAVADTEEIDKVAWVPMANVSSMYASHFDWFTVVYGRLLKHDSAAGTATGASPKTKRVADELSGDAQ